MAPNAKENLNLNSFDSTVVPKSTPYKKDLVYSLIFAFLYLHIASIYAVKCIFVAKWGTLVFMLLCYLAGIVSLTAGLHRYWSHRSFKATLPLQVILVVFQSMINQFSIIWWVQIHRRHHKFSDTDGDPMNASRGFFYSHIGWLLMNRHPDASRKKNEVDISDVLNHPLLRFQKRYAIPVIGFFSFVLPTMVPLLWNEDLLTIWHLNILRLTLTYNNLFTINSVGHLWGNRPYDKSLMSTQSWFTNIVAFGDGYHNYHHTFPWDYRGGEWGGGWNFTTGFIDLCAKLGLVYDMKTVPDDVIVRRATRTGDGSIDLEKKLKK